MRALMLSAVALALLPAGPALASGPTGGGHSPSDPCCAPPPPSAPCCAQGGGSRNVTINVNASARAFGEASSASHFNARTYDLRGIGGRGYGGTVYVGGYGGEVGGYGLVGTPVYHDIDRRVLACANAPFGYVVAGFGRDGRRPPSCGGRYDPAYGEYDRGGRYGYSERHDRYEERSSQSYERYEEYGVYAYDGPVEDADYGISDYERGYIEGRRDCDCHDRGPAPYPPAYLPEPPRYEPPSYPRPYEPRAETPPRQQDRQELGERG